MIDSLPTDTWSRRVERLVFATLLNNKPFPSIHTFGAQMPSSDQPSPLSSPHLPAPPSGAAAADLVTSSDDPQELRDLLDRARERLAFYESFDRIIGENIRRSGELMVETVTLREQAHTISSQAAKERAEFEAHREADRAHYRSLLQNALDEVASIQPVIDGVMTRLQDVMDQINAGANNESDTSGSLHVDTVATTSDLVEPWSTPSQPEPETSEAEPDIETTIPAETRVALDTDDAEAGEAAPITTAADPESGPDEVSDVTSETPASDLPRTIDVLAHAVPNARIAISLQKMLRGLDVVTEVEAREFAEGELRLAVTTTGEIPTDALGIWLTDNRGDITSTSASVIELTFSEA